MLELTRIAGQGVKIGDDHKLFVQEVRAGYVVCRLYCPIYDVLHPITRDKPLEIHVGTTAVRIHCMKAARGQVRLGFEAPRELIINRIEREPK